MADLPSDCIRGEQWPWAPLELEYSLLSSNYASYEVRALSVMEIVFKSDLTGLRT